MEIINKAAQITINFVGGLFLLFTVIDIAILAGIGTVSLYALALLVSVAMITFRVKEG